MYKKMYMYIPHMNNVYLYTRTGLYGIPSPGTWYTTTGRTTLILVLVLGTVFHVVI